MSENLNKKNVLKGLKLVGEIYLDVCPECREKVIDAWIRNAPGQNVPRDTLRKVLERAGGAKPS